MIDAMDLKKIPKVELHLHLDGSVRVSTLLEYAKKDIKDQVVAPDKCLDLGEYLTKFTLPNEYLQKKDNLVTACYELSEDLENDGVIYAEVRFSPIKLTKGDMTLEEVVETTITGFNKSNIKISLILCMMRNDSFETNMKIINLAEKYLDKGVVALDLAGDEKEYETSSFDSLFEIIKEKNIPFTIHAGEINDETSIKTALSYGAKRLGHGINSVYYQDIIDKLKKESVLLEICPTSNVQTNAVENYSLHPIKKLKDLGCLLCINTDNRTVSNITLTEEYRKLVENFNFTKEDFCYFNLMAINHSFLKAKEQEHFKNIILNYLNFHK